jgi:hypothetical protein
MGRASGAAREARPGNTNARPRASYEAEATIGRLWFEKSGLSARKPCRRRLAEKSTSAISSPRPLGDHLGDRGRSVGRPIARHVPSLHKLS